MIELLDELQKLYIRLLHTGLIEIKTASELDQKEWLKAEINFLHNIPSLLNETNIQRHRYFWEKERPYYLERIEELNLDEEIRIMSFYDNILQEMEPLMLKMFRQENQTGDK
ncbi:hypothetical protein [Gimesia aquarii]|uniref:Uncharacterized protein n=1 Tax=Gimesia aquarii TaxID=2527964 RepID=A0A517VXE7_9PLAN|nr:hypothetical protein [Gimesia aquarii]QDT97676.1 hypothetical protein V144x_31560 [Gimesia aquarii]